MWRGTQVSALSSVLEWDENTEACRDAKLLINPLDFLQLELLWKFVKEQQLHAFLDRYSRKYLENMNTDAYIALISIAAEATQRT